MIVLKIPMLRVKLYYSACEMYLGCRLGLMMNRELSREI